MCFVIWIWICLKTTFTTSDKIVFWKYFNVDCSISLNLNLIYLLWVSICFCNFSSVVTIEFCSLYVYVVIVLDDSVEWLSLPVVSLFCFLLSPSVWNSFGSRTPYSTIQFLLLMLGMMAFESLGHLSASLWRAAVYENRLEFL